LIFLAYLGEDNQSINWKNLVNKHANWLGLIPQLETIVLKDKSKFEFGWLKPKSFHKKMDFIKTDEYIFFSTLHGFIHNKLKEEKEINWQLATSQVQDNDTCFCLSQKTAKLAISLPPATPEQLFYSKDSDNFTFSNDLRFMMRYAGGEFDERAVFALFQYNAVPPTLTLSKNVHRIPNGHLFGLSLVQKTPTLKANFIFPKIGPSNGKSEAKVQNGLSKILMNVPESTVLYFSGGIDSALLASLFVKMERSDIQLINYSFGEQDEESKLAAKMADHLKLQYNQISYEPSDVPLMLNRLGQDYTFPFGDKSVIPTNLLVHASLPFCNRSDTVVEGTGADGAFAMGLKYKLWKRMFAIPGFVRILLGFGYKWLNLWQVESNLERLFHTARRSVLMPLEHAAALAQNSLDGIAYRIQPSIRKKLEETIKNRLEILLHHLEPEEKISLLDIMHVCAGEFAAKTFDPLHIRGVKPIYPFLEPFLLKICTSLSWSEKSESGEEKALLKRLLVKTVPSEMVYRPKSPFNPPFREILMDDLIQEMINDIVLSHNNPFFVFCEKNTVKKMMNRAYKGKILNVETYFFIANLMFASLWLNQLER